MPSVAVSQLTLNFEPTMHERFRTLREYIGHRVQVQPKPAKTIAGDMDMSPSILSRKLAPSDGDTQRFQVGWHPEAALTIPSMRGSKSRPLMRQAGLAA